MRYSRLVIVLASAILLTAIPLAADPVGWRMGGDGRYLDADAPAEWSPTKNVLWKTKMPSWSNASPVLLEDQGLVIVLSGGSNGACSSITLAGDKLFLGTENGASVVFKPGSEYEEIARNQVEGYRSTPIFDGDRMYLRAFDYLYCFSSKAD